MSGPDERDGDYAREFFDGYERAADHPAWRDFDVLFIGGTTEWKLGPYVRDLIAQAKAHGKHVHMGRVNSERRYRYAMQLGCDSADGTFLTHGPDALRRMRSWLHLPAQGSFDFGDAS